MDMGIYNTKGELIGEQIVEEDAFFDTDNESGKCNFLRKQGGID